MDEREQGPGFLSRWSQRKLDARDTPADALCAPAPSPALSPRAEDDRAAQAPLPTMDDVERLTPDADFTRFVGAKVDPSVRNAALKKLFSDPHFNVMDGLDTYIDDYNAPDPLPAAMLRQMVQARVLGLLDEHREQGQQTPHEDADMRLQPDDAAGCDGPQPSAEPHARREP